MNDTLLMILIGLMSLTLLTLAWAVIGLLMVAKRELPKLQQQVNAINGRVVQVLDELVPTLHGATQTLKEAERTLHEAAETVQNLHIVSDNLRHKLEVADAVGAKVRRLPEKTARALGKLMHQGFKLGGRLLSQQLEKRLQATRATIYDGVRSLDNPVQADPKRGLDNPVQADPKRGLDNPVQADPKRGLSVPPTHDRESAIAASSERMDSTVHATGAASQHTGGDARATENSASQLAERIPNGEATTHTTHKEG
ncbi:MAG: hypothetical protein KatS3mg019_0172 [Fimbriimonadales bacterium]|nr:MAG: hypothetical protein KatS3mg019_0172 [Fimbriimonadales bacterium]